MYNFIILKKVIVIIGLFCFLNLSQAGAYEDFFKAVKSDNVRTIQALLQRGFDPNTVNPEGVGQKPKPSCETTKTKVC
jgi:hypothetical protein